ncbi:unnamed protein product [Closterium sp. NIES-54]
MPRRCPSLLRRCLLQCPSRLWCRKHQLLIPMLLQCSHLPSLLHLSVPAVAVVVEQADGELDVVVAAVVDEHPVGRPSVLHVTPIPSAVPLELFSDSFGPTKGGDPAANDTATSRSSPCLETPPSCPPQSSPPPLQPVAVDSGRPGAIGVGDTRGTSFGGADSGVDGYGCADSGGVESPLLLSPSLPDTAAGGSKGAVSGGIGGTDAGAGGAGAGGAGAGGTRAGAGDTDSEGVGRAGAGGVSETGAPGVRIGGA